MSSNNPFAWKKRGDSNPFRWVSPEENAAKRWEEENKYTVTEGRPFASLTPGAYVDDDNSVIVGLYKFSNVDYVDGIKNGYIVQNNGIDTISDFEWAKSKGSIPTAINYKNQELAGITEKEINEGIANKLSFSLAPYVQKYGVDSPEYQAELKNLMGQSPDPKVTGFLQQEYVNSYMRNAIKNPTSSTLSEIYGEERFEREDWFLDIMESPMKGVVDSEGNNIEISPKQYLETLAYNNDQEYRDDVERFLKQSAVATTAGERNKIISEIDSTEKLKDTYDSQKGNIGDEVVDLFLQLGAFVGKRDVADAATARIKSRSQARTNYGEAKDKLAYLETQLDKTGMEYNVNKEVAYATSSSDFDKYGKYIKGTTPALDGIGETVAEMNLGLWKEIDKDALERAKEKLGKELDMTVEWDLTGVTDDELKTYYYLANTKGKEAAEEFAKNIEIYSNERAGFLKAAYMDEIEGGGASKYVSHVLASGQKFGEIPSNLWASLTKDTSYKPPNADTVASSAIVDDAKGVSKFTHEGAKAVSDLIPTIAVGIASKAAGAAKAAKVMQIAGQSLFGASVYSKTYREAVNSGRPWDEAVQYAGAVTATELVTEKLLGSVPGFGDDLFQRIGASKWIDEIAKVNPKLGTYYKIGTNILGHSFSEALEESFAGVVDTLLWKPLILGEKVNIDWKQLSEEAIVGGLVGATLNAPSSLKSAYKVAKGNTLSAKIEYINQLSDGEVVSLYVDSFKDDLLVPFVFEQDESSELTEEQQRANIYKFKENAKKNTSVDFVQRARLAVTEEVATMGVIEAFSEAAKDGKEFETAIKEIENSGLEFSDYEDVARIAYNAGKTNASTDMESKLSGYESLITGDKATGYVAEKMTENNNGITREEATRIVNMQKNKTFAQSISKMSADEKAKAIKKYAQNEKEAENEYWANRNVELLNLAEKRFNESGVNFNRASVSDASNTIARNLAVKLSQMSGKTASASEIKNAVLSSLVKSGKVDIETLARSLADSFTLTLPMSSDTYKNLVSSGTSATDALVNYALNGIIPDSVTDKEAFKAVGERFKEVLNSAVSQISNARTRLFGDKVLNVAEKSDTIESKESAERTTKSKFEAIKNRLIEKYGEEVANEFIKEGKDISSDISVHTKEVSGKVVSAFKFVPHVLESIASDGLVDARNIIKNGIYEVLSPYDIDKADFDVISDMAVSRIEETLNELYETSADEKNDTSEIAENTPEDNSEAISKDLEASVMGVISNGPKSETYVREGFDDVQDSTSDETSNTESTSLDENDEPVATDEIDQKPYTVTKTKHTSTGEDIWVVSLNNKISKEEFAKLRDEVKKAGGYYSRFAKTLDGKALPGFVFKVEPGADALAMFENDKNVQKEIKNDVSTTKNQEQNGDFIESRESEKDNNPGERLGILQASEAGAELRNRNSESLDDEFSGRTADDSRSADTEGGNIKDTEDESGRVLRRIEDRPLEKICETESFSNLSQFIGNEVSPAQSKAFIDAYINGEYGESEFDLMQLVAYDVVSDENNNLREIFSDNIDEYFLYDSLDSTQDITGRTVPDNVIESFKNTVVKNAKGSLIPVYHGTDKYYSQLKRGETGIHFGSYAQAANRAKDKGFGAPYFVKAYLNITNPVIIEDDYFNWNAPQLAHALSRVGVISADEAVEIAELARLEGIEKANEGIVRKLKELGYDGVIYQNAIEAVNGKSYIVFDEGQIFRLDGDSYNSASKENTENDREQTGILGTESEGHPGGNVSALKTDPRQGTENSELLSTKNGIVTLKKPKGYESAFKKSERIIVGKEYIANGFVGIRKSLVDTEKVKTYANKKYSNISENDEFDLTKYFTEGANLMITGDPKVIEVPRVARAYSFKIDGGYYIYNQQFVDAFAKDGNTFWVNPEKPNSAMVIKNADGESIGLIMPIRSSSKNDASLAEQTAKRHNEAKYASEVLEEKRQEKASKKETAEFSYSLDDSESDLTQRHFSPSEKVVQAFADSIDKWLSGNMKSNEYFELGETPTVLKELGAKDLPVIMSQDVIIKITGEKHSISLDEIKRLPEAIHDPIMVFSSATVPNAFVLITELSDKSGNSVIAALHLNRGDKHFKVNRVSSVYGKNNIANFVETQSELGNLRYIDKEKNHSWSQSRGLQLPKLADTISDSTNNILQKEDIVNSILFENGEKDSGNVRKSVAQNDDEYLDAVESGDVETAQRMVEEAAKNAGYDSPLLYHGTSAFGFTEFDLSKSDDKRTIFLTSNEKIASTYSGVEGKRQISDIYDKKVDKLSNEELVNELNGVVKKYGSFDDRENESYSFYDYGRINRLINEVNNGLEELKPVVDEKIKEYAERMAVDFNDKDAKVHKQLVELGEKLDGWEYNGLSTPIYMLLHHTDVFSDINNVKKIAELEKNIRLMNKVRSSKNLDEGVIVSESLGGYYVNTLSRDMAARQFRSIVGKGNYSMYAKIENPLLIDAHGELWNSIYGWSDEMVPEAGDVEVIKEGNEYRLKDKNTGEYIEDAVIAVNDATLSMTDEERKTFILNKIRDMWSIRTENIKTTRGIAKYAKEHGYGSVIIKNLVDNGGNNPNVDPDTKADIYILFDSNNAKSADPVTYDDDGNVIPLSKRFNPEKNDIRYSIEGQTSIFESEREETNNGKENDGNLLSNGIGRWQNGESTGKPTQSLDGRTSRYKERRETSRQRREYCKALKDAGNTSEEIIFGHKCEVIPKDFYSDKAKRIAEKNSKQGIETIFVTGKVKLPIKNKSGDFKTAKGVFINKGGKKTIIVQYDNEYFMPEQINDHELIHDRYESPLVQKVKNIILNNLTEAEKNDVLEKLSRDYNGIIEGNEEAIFEEFVANVLSEMDYDYLARFRDLEKAFWKGDEEFIDSYDAATYAESFDSGGTYEQVEYTEKQLRGFGWAYSNGLMNKGEYKDFWSKFADAVKGRATFEKSKNGEYIIPVSDINDDSVYGIDNTLVFAKGNIDNPKITGIIKIDANNETFLDEIRRYIYDCERRGIQREIEGVFRRYDSSSFEPEQSRVVFEGNRSNKSNELRGRSSEETPETQRRDEVKYSLDDDGIYDFGDIWRELLEEYGYIPKGENPVRDVDVPKKTEEDKPVSRTVRTVLEAEATPEEVMPDIASLVKSGDFSYDVYTDEKAISDAEARIKKLGWADSLSTWLKDVESGTVSKEQTAMGWALYNNAANSGDVDTAMTILDAMVKHQRSAAQALQAARILKKLSPDTQLYGVQKSIARLNEELLEKYKDRAPELELDKKLAEEFLNAETQEKRDEILKEIYRNIGRQMPSTWVDKWNAWRYLAMLGNFRTHVRNIFGNTFFVPVVVVKDLTATGIESVVRVVTGGKTVKGKSLVTVKKSGRALLKSAWNDYKNVADTVSNGGKYNDFANANKYIEEGRVIFKGFLNGRFNPLEWARKGNSKLLDMEDMWFSKPHYAYALAQYCESHGITPEQVAKGEGIEAARDYAIKEAQKATYRDTNAFSQMVSEWGRRGKNQKGVRKAVSMGVEGVLPFRKTPANILVRGVEYSPVGLVKGLTYDLHRVSKNEITASEAIDNISAGLTGTGLLALGMWLAAEGLIRGRGEDDEEERKFKEMMGHQAYSLELPNGTSITLDWLAPEALPFFAGVNLYEVIRDADGEINLANVLSAIGSIGDPLLEMSCLQGLNDLIENVGYAASDGNSGLMSIAASAVTSYFSQGIPTLFGQAERTFQDSRMTTYTEKNAFLTEDMQYTLGKLSAKTPGWDYNQIPYIDAWGRKEASEKALERGFNNFLNPAYMSKIETSDMEKELLRLYELTGDSAVLPDRAKKYFTSDGKRIDLTAEQYVQYAMDKGQKSYNLITNLVNSEAYKRLDDNEKVKAIDEAFTYADEKAKQAVLDSHKSDKWVGTADGFGDENVGNFFAFRAGVSETRKENDGKVTKAEVVDIIKDTAETDDEAWDMYLSEYDSTGSKYAKDNGIDGNVYLEFLEVLGDVDKPTESGKYGTYTQDEAKEAIKRLEGLSKQEKAILWQSVNTKWKNNPYK